MKIILCPNHRPPYNVYPARPNWPLYLARHGTEEAALAAAVAKFKSPGTVPAETAEERVTLVAEFLRKNTHRTDADFPPVGLHWVVEEEDLPDIYFLDTWEWTDKIAVNMPKARGWHMDVIRRARNKELVQRDVTFMRAVEAGDSSAQATVAAEKQTLRDIPQTFDLTTDTPAQLKALWPSELPARE